MDDVETNLIDMQDALKMCKNFPRNFDNIDLSQTDILFIEKEKRKIRTKGHIW